MHQIKERAEKICLNCNSEVFGRYCHICGQENIKPEESIWHIISHFISDVTHFDGKFFNSIKYLIFKPGFLTSEYLKGRRATYLHPIRMYVFTSFIFFLIIFFNAGHKDVAQISKSNLMHEKDSLMHVVKQYKDSVQHGSFRYNKELLQTEAAIEHINSQIVQLRFLGKVDPKYTGFDTTGIAKAEMIKAKRDAKYSSIKGYDSIQQHLGVNAKSSFVKSFFIKKFILANEKYQYREGEFVERFKANFSHSIPKMMFISLPLIALLLQLLYIRRKNIRYVSHAIFTIHTYIAIFLLLLITYLFDWLNAISQWRIFEWLAGLTIIAIFYYVYKAMRNFYNQGRRKTFLKFLLFSFFSSVFLTLLALIFAVNSFLFL